MSVHQTIKRTIRNWLLTHHGIITRSDAYACGANDAYIRTSAGLVTIPLLVAELDRVGRRGRPGPGVLRRQLQARRLIGGPQPSVLESRTLRLIEQAGLPAPVPELQAGQDGRYRLDFAYPDIHFAVEVDGYVWHSSPEQVQLDNARRRDLQRQGWLLQVYTWPEITEQAAQVIAEIAAAYARLADGASRS